MAVVLFRKVEPIWAGLIFGLLAAAPQAAGEVIIDNKGQVVAHNTEFDTTFLDAGSVRIDAAKQVRILTTDKKVQPHFELLLQRAVARPPASKRHELLMLFKPKAGADERTTEDGPDEWVVFSNVITIEIIPLDVEELMQGPGRIFVPVEDRPWTKVRFMRMTDVRVPTEEELMSLGLTRFQAAAMVDTMLGYSAEEHAARRSRAGTKISADVAREHQQKAFQKLGGEGREVAIVVAMWMLLRS